MFHPSSTAPKPSFRRRKHGLFGAEPQESIVTVYGRDLQIKTTDP